MIENKRTSIVAALVAGALLAPPVWADPFFFSTGNPDGKIGTLSRPAGNGHIQTETADDFILKQNTSINQASIFGLLPSGTSLASIKNVEVEIYHVFPRDSAFPPSGNVFTRVNSPSDVEIASATRDGTAGTLAFSAALVNARFSVLNTVVNGINKFPNQFTGGEGPATGIEALITIFFNTPIVLGPDHYFFRPEVELTDGTFLYLSAPKPITGGSGPFDPDLQSWIRNDDLAPDWSRIGSDITGQGPFNAAFSLTGVTVPEPATLALVGLGAILMFGRLRRSRGVARFGQANSENLRSSQGTLEAQLI